MILRSGIDLIEIDRLVKIRPSLRERFLRRVFTTREVAECNDSNERLAGRFAAKEAVAKALGCGIGPVRWQDIEVLRGESGEPLLHLWGNAALRSQELGLSTWSVSITHTRTYAAATAVAIGQEAPPAWRNGKMNILAVSDEEMGIIYSPSIAERFKNNQIMVSCGDLPYYYLEYMISTLNKPLYFVRGNHAHSVEYGTGGERNAPWGGMDLHRRVRLDDSGVLLAGIEGCLRYNYGPYQYTQAEMWSMVWMLTPVFFMNRLRFGRYLDIFVAHAPPWKIHDLDDRPHQGIRAFRWLIDVFHPSLFLHGHIHLYRNNAPRETLVKKTRVINTYGYREIVI